jgi:hypothetical protein
MVVLLVVAAAEPVLLASADTLDRFAERVVVIQVAAAVAIVVAAALARHDPLAGQDPLTGV